MRDPKTGSHSTSGMKRVAYLTNMLLDWETLKPRFGGGESYCLTLGRLLRDLGFEVTFFQAGNTAFEGDYYGFRVIAIPHGAYVSEFQTGICNVFYHLTQNYDHVIHNIPTYASGTLRDDALVICHSVWFDHNNYKPPIEFRTPQWFDELYRAFSRPRCIVSVDTNVINVIRALWPELVTRMTFIPSFVDTDLFSPPMHRENDKLTILFPRRAEYTRGSRLLEPILDRVPHDCRFLWVGEGEPEETTRIKALVERDRRLKFLAASFEEVPGFYKQADICVIPAVASEGTCLASLEALASGCAVIATNVGGLANILQPSVNGLMTGANADEIAAAINRLIEDPQERARLQNAGPETAKHFSLNVWRRRWAQLLYEMGWIDWSALETVESAGRAASIRSNDLPPLEEIIALRTVIARLVNEMTETERRLDVQIEELITKDKIIETRDEAIAWLQDEMKTLEEQSMQLTDSTAHKERLQGEERLVQALESRVAEQEQFIEEMRAQWQVLERASNELSALRKTQIAEIEKVVRARDEGIAWLKDEITHLQNKARQIVSANDLLSNHLAEKESGRQVLLGQLRASEEELNRIKGSLGWRLLCRYGKIKYRYLLPAYRLVRPRPKTQTEQPVTAPLTTEGDPSLQEKIDQLLRATEALLAGSPAQTEPAHIEKPDFYDSLTLLHHLREEQVGLILNQKPALAAERQPDVICFAIIDWEFRYQRPQQIMSQFATNGHRVFYATPSRFQSPKASPRVAVSKIKENVYEVQLAALRQPDIYGEVVGGGECEALIESLRELRETFRIDEAIGYVMIASWGNLALCLQQLWGWRVIYDCMDEWENFPGIKPSLLEMEKRLVRECDLLVVTARRLFEKWQPCNRPTVLARNAADYDFYFARCHPNDILADVKHPVVGYYGAIADWFDVELMTGIARRRPNYTFVLLGGVFDVDVSALRALSNVRLLGQQPYELMPQYLYHFDACIIPFKLNSITQATDPVKVYEYLSGGKPVVSVALHELDYCRDYVHIAEDMDDFLSKLDKAVTEDDPAEAERRRGFARQQTWQSRYESIAEGIKSVTPQASIIVATYNNLALNKLCLESLIRNTEYPNFEVVVVDNASEDGTPSYLRYMAARYPYIKIILNQENRGFAAAKNQGIARAEGDYFVLLNHDTVVPPGWLSRLLRHLRHPEVGMVGPVTNFVGNEAKIAVTYSTWGEMEAFARQHTWEHDGQVADIHMLAMFCVAFRRDTYDAIGPLDEQFGIGMFEDDDYSQRMKAQGYRVICAADVFVHHFGQAAFKKLIDKGDYNPLFEENRRRYETRWNVEWVPHRNLSLDFQPFVPSPEAAGEIKNERRGA